MLNVFSFGGGVQSTAALVLAAQGRIDFPTFLFANVGDDSENPDTLAYVREVARPYAIEHEIELIELPRRRLTGVRKGEVRTLYSDMITMQQRRVPIPVRLKNGAPGNRACTEEYKIQVISRWLRKATATKAHPATLGMGISLDEIQRMRTDDPRYPHIHKEYPLIELRLSRADCATLIDEAGLPVPPKSSCWFCPFKTLSQWQELRWGNPQLFEKAVALEGTINRRRAALGKDEVYLSRKLRPLDQIVGTLRQATFDDTLDEPCDSGFCMI